MADPRALRALRTWALEWLRAASLADRVMARLSAEFHWSSDTRRAVQDAAWTFVRHLGVLSSRFGFSLTLAKHVERADREGLDKALEFVFMSGSDAQAKCEEWHLRARPEFSNQPAEHLERFHHFPKILWQAHISGLAEQERVHQMLHDGGVRAPLTLRCRGADPAFFSRWSALGLTPDPWVRGAFSISSQPSRDILDPKYEEIQDAHSQLVGLLPDLAPGMRVLDLCAGGGGKTVQLADRVGSIRVVATDRDSKRLHAAQVRARRAGLTNVQCVEWENLDGLFDVVLVDAPCSGSGTWRRHPDILRQLSVDRMRELRWTQRSLIEKALSLVRPGGQVYFATCSVFSWEGEGLLQEMGVGTPSDPEWFKGFCVRASERAEFLTLLETHRCRLGHDEFRISPGSQESGSLSGDGFFFARLR